MNKSNLRTILVLGPVLLSGLIAACGDSSPVAPVRGSLNGGAGSPLTVTKAAIDAGSSASGAIALTGAALCDVKISSVQYNTVGGKGEATLATTAIMVPSGTNAGCNGARPTLVYTHGTTIKKNDTMADVAGNAEAALVMTFYAAQGFIVIAPNYTGYQGSTLSYHPYLNAEAQANDVIDAIRAAKASLSGLGGTPSTKLFITGYSQGGHVAMATHREIQNKYAGEIAVTASGPMSGPYALEKFGLTVYSGTVNGGATIFTPLLVDSYQNSYGNIYAKASDLYQAPYDTIAPGLLPSTDPAAASKLPGNLFDLVDFNPFLIKTSYRNDVLANANNGFRLASKKNDLLGWKPSVPVAICYGANDPVVFGFNSVDSIASIKALGGNVTEFNLENAATVSGSIKAAFDAQKTAISNGAGGGAAGANAVLSNYHAPLVPPYCNFLVREFFRNQL
jgi:hypothetical protein